MACVIILSKESSAFNGDSVTARELREDKYCMIDLGEQRSRVPITSPRAYCLGLISHICLDLPKIPFPWDTQPLTIQIPHI